MRCVLAVEVLLLNLANPELDWKYATRDEDRLAGSIGISCDFVSTERFVGGEESDCIRRNRRVGGFLLILIG